ncbi:MAG: ABC transporter substrate-binding protein [Rubrivivax sp.]|nr:ABC transporter substrate-binding protein [Rubrivivax sp.]
MHKFRRRLTSMLAAALFAAAALAPAAAQKRGGTFIVASEGEPGVLTAHLSTDTSAVMIASNVFNGLVTADFALQPKPELAERWEISPDERTYTFHLVKNAKWHDGKPVTAHDAAFTLNEITSKTHPRAGAWWPNVDFVRAVDDHTLVIHLKAPYAPFLILLGNSLGMGTLIMPKHLYEGKDPKTNPANRAPVGSGPFKFSKWERGSHVELVRNPNYFRAGKPYLDRVVFRFVPDAATRLLGVEKGELDFLHAYIVPYNEVERLKKSPKVQVVNRGLEMVATNEFLFFNLRNGPLKDVRVRQALAHAIDRNEIRARALFDLGRVAHSHLSSSLGWAYSDKFDAYKKRDVAQAAALLDAAGYPLKDGKRFALRLTWDSGKEVEHRTAEIIRSNLRDVGIDVTMQTFDRATYIEKTYRNWDFDMAIQNSTTGPDPAIGVTRSYHTRQILKLPFVNGMGYSNPELDKIFDAEFSVFDVKKRAAMWHRAQELLMRDLPGLPLFEFPVLNIASAGFNNVISGPMGYLESRENISQK